MQREVDGANSTGFLGVTRDGSSQTNSGPFETVEEAVQEFLDGTHGWATNKEDPPPEPESVGELLLGQSLIVWELPRWIPVTAVTFHECPGYDLPVATITDLATGEIQNRTADQQAVEVV